jgi:hypothetical protein
MGLFIAVLGSTPRKGATEKSTMTGMLQNAAPDENR